MTHDICHVWTDAKRRDALQACARKAGLTLEPLHLGALTTGSAAQLAQAAQADALIVDAADMEALCATLTAARPEAGLQPLIAVCAVAGDFEHAARSGAHAALGLPFSTDALICASRAATRASMLRHEVQAQGGTAMRSPRKRRVARVGGACANLSALGEHTILSVADDASVLIALAAAKPDAVILDANNRGFCAMVLAQARRVSALRLTPFLAAGDDAMALMAEGAADVLTPDMPAAAVALHVLSACERKDLSAALQRLARDAAKSAAAASVKYDPVTGLADGETLARAITVLAGRSASRGKPASLMLIGPDPVAAGQTLPDSAWKDLAAVILRGLRGLDLAARLDATRFAILMPGTDAQGAQRAAERLCQDIALERLRFGPERRQGLTCSVGVAAGHAEDASGLLPLANAALDEAIRNGPSAAHGRSMTAAA